MSAARQTDPLVESFDRLVTDDSETVLVAGSSREMTAAALDTLSRTLGRAFSEPAAATSLRIGLLAPNGPGFLAALLACRRRARTPILLDSGMPSDEIARTAAAFGFAEVLRIHAAWPEREADFAIERFAPTVRPRRHSTARPWSSGPPGRAARPEAWPSAPKRCSPMIAPCAKRCPSATTTACSPRSRSPTATGCRASSSLRSSRGCR